MEDYKQDIINTRKGCLGGSDATIIAQVANSGMIPKGAMKRLAVCKGLIEADELPSTSAMRYGDFIEQSIYDCLKQTDERYESNPCLVSELYSRPSVKVIDHVDFYLKDDDEKTISLYECKASKYSTDKVKEIYKPQLYHHFLMGKEIAGKLGKEWKVRVILVHYDTNGIDLDNDAWEFDSNRMCLVPIRFSGKYYDMAKGMDIINDFLEGFNEYYEGDVISSDYLPSEIKDRFSAIATCLKEIKEREKKVEEFKDKLYEFFSSKGIKKVDFEEFGFTLIEPTKSVSFDAKAYMDDFEKKYPRKAKKIREQYSKVTNKRGYIKIAVKTEKQND